MKMNRRYIIVCLLTLLITGLHLHRKLMAQQCCSGQAPSCECGVSSCENGRWSACPAAPSCDYGYELACTAGEWSCEPTGGGGGDGGGDGGCDVCDPECSDYSEVDCGMSS